MAQSFEDFLRAQGLIVDRTIIAGGKIQRFNPADKKSSKSCWAILFAEGDAGIWGDWREQESHYWRADGREYKQLTAEEKADYARKQEIARRMIEEEKERLAIDSLDKWNAILEGEVSEYLLRKQVGAYGIKIDLDGRALVPARDIHGKFWNYQNISGNPKMFRRGRSAGCFHIIEGNRSQIILASGYATAASIHEATGLCTIVCFGDGNVLEVARTLKNAGWKNLKGAVDNDTGGSLSGNKIGQRIADELGLPCVMPDAPGDFNDHAVLGENIYRYFYETTPVFSFGDLMGDSSPMPDDIIYPRVLTEGGMLVFGGAPKVGKSDFMLSWLAHMAGGIPFMGMMPPRPLKIFYLQAEVQYDYLRERVKGVAIEPSVLTQVNDNLYITPQFRMLLDEGGVEKVGHTIRQCFGGESPDIIAIDPISNVYDKESENDNAQMMAFLSQRVEGLRQYADPKTGFMLVHHTKKIAKDELAKDPFQMFSGASSLRRYYTTGMLMYRPDEEVSECVLTYEVRNGPRIKNINIDKLNGVWTTIEHEFSRIAKNDSDKTARDERARKISIITNELEFEISRGEQHTIRSFSDFMAHKSGLGAAISINRLLNELVAQKVIFNNPDEDGKRRFLSL